MSPDTRTSLILHEPSLAARVRQAVADISKNSETIALAAFQVQQVLLDVDGNSSERELRAASVAGKAISAQLALLALDVTLALGTLETVADVRAIAAQG